MKMEERSTGLMELWGGVCGRAHLRRSGTTSGPVRFDGVQFERYVAASRVRSSRLPNSAGFLGVHGLASGALKRLAELFEVPNGVIHAHLTR
jgi:hypothetical protein